MAVLWVGVIALLISGQTRWAELLLLPTLVIKIFLVPRMWASYKARRIERPLKTPPTAFTVLKVVSMVGVVALVLTRHWPAALVLTSFATLTVSIEALALGGFNDRLRGFISREERPVLYWVGIAFGAFLSGGLLLAALGIWLMHPDRW